MSKGGQKWASTCGEREKVGARGSQPPALWPWLLGNMVFLSFCARTALHVGALGVNSLAFLILCLSSLLRLTCCMWLVKRILTARFRI